MIQRRRNNFPTLSRNKPSTQTQFSDWLDEFFDEAFILTSGSFTPEMNVYEKDDAFELTLELPGMKKEDIEISMEGNILRISGERKATRENESQTFHRVESRFGTFNRSLPLPQNIKHEDIEASYQNGVLTINIPKAEQSTGKQIEVK